MTNINEAFQEFQKTLVYARVYVRDNQEELKRKYGLQYLAIAENAGVIDSEEDKSSLIKRLQSSGDQRGIVIETIANLTKSKVSNQKVLAVCLGLLDAQDSPRTKVRGFPRILT